MTQPNPQPTDPRETNQETANFLFAAKLALYHRDTPNYWGLTRPETPEDALLAAADIYADAKAAAKVQEAQRVLTKQALVCLQSDYDIHHLEAFLKRQLSALTKEKP